jgi:chromate reductase
MRILAISGSLRRDSHNTSLLRAAADHLPPGVELELWDGLRDVPPYDEDDDVEHAPAAVAGLRAAVAGADAVLISTPEYNHSIPGALKNALDWASRPFATNAFRGKPVAVIGASTGLFGAVWAQAELKKVLAAMGARVVEGDVVVGQAGEKIDGGVLVDADHHDQLHDALAALIAEVEPAAAPAQSPSVAAEAPAKSLSVAA